MTDYASQITESKAAKQASMEQVEDHANATWLDLMLELVRLTCLERPRFTVDDPMDRYHAIDDGDKPTTHDLRAMGPVMTRAAKAGYCRKTNITEGSRRKSCHNRPLAVWQSLICEAAE